MNVTKDTKVDFSFCLKLEEMIRTGVTVGRSGKRFENIGRSTKYRLARLLGRTQMKAFRRIGAATRPWSARFTVSDPIACTQMHLPFEPCTSVFRGKVKTNRVK
jgi:hypothetical protein